MPKRAERAGLSRRTLIAVAGAAAAPAFGAEKKKGGGARFLPLPTLTASIIRFEGGRGVLTVEGGLDIADAGLRSRAEASTPRLLDAYSQVLRRYGAGLAPGRPPDADLIGHGLQAETDRVLGRPGARFLLGAILLN